MHEAKALHMSGENLLNKAETQLFSAVHYNQRQIHWVEWEVLSNIPAYQELCHVRCILHFPRTVMKFEEGGGAVLVSCKLQSKIRVSNEIVLP